MRTAKRKVPSLDFIILIAQAVSVVPFGFGSLGIRRHGSIFPSSMSRREYVGELGSISSD